MITSMLSCRCLINVRILMILKISKLLIVSVLFAASIDKSYCMNDLSQNIDFDMNNRLVFNNILINIKSNNKLLQQYKEQISNYRQKLEYITSDMIETNKSLQESLMSFSENLYEDMDTESEIVNNQINCINECNIEKNTLVELIKNYNKQEQITRYEIGEQSKLFYNELFGNNFYFNKINNFILHSTEDTLNIVYELLNTYDIKNHITTTSGLVCKFGNQVGGLSGNILNNDNIVRFKNNKEQFKNTYKQTVNNIFKEEYENIEEFMNKFNNIQENENNIKDKIINIVKEYLSIRKNEILQYEKRIIDSHIKKLENEINK